MLGLPLHPVLAHLVIGLAVAVAGLGLLVLLGWRRGLLPRRAWWLVVALQTGLLAATVGGVRSGELAEREARQVLEARPVDRHERLAKRFAIVAFGAGILCAAAGLRSEERAARRTGALALLALWVQLGAAGWAGHAGGGLVWGEEGLLEAARSGERSPSVRGHDHLGDE